jgi:hypothetical protein
MSEVPAKLSNKKKMMHLWMVEDLPVTGSRPEKKSYWTKIGVAFENRDGSFSLELSAIPVTGRMQMREPADRRDEIGAGVLQ